MIRSAAVIALAALASSATAQDLTIAFKTTDGATGANYFTKDRLRMTNGRSDTIMEFSTGKMTHIDHQKKEYSEITLAEMESMMKAASAQMEEAMAKVPPQMRDQMAKMMGGAAAEASVTKGDTRTIAGYPCQVYILAMGAMTQETCNSTAITPPFDPANFVKMQRITIPPIQGMDKLAKKMSEVQGLPLMSHSTVTMMGRKTVNGMEATEVRKGPIPADVFAIPAGYKQVESPMKAMGKMGPR